MIRERATVVAVAYGHVEVRTTPTAGCGACTAAGGCGVGALAAFSARRGRSIRLAASPGLRRGDTVDLGIQERALLQAAATVYLLPLILLLVGAAAGERLAVAVGGHGDWGALAVVGLILLGWWALAPRLRARIPAVQILGRVTDGRALQGDMPGATPGPDVRQ